MKVHNAWQIEFKQDIPIQVFSLFLKAVRKVRSAFGVSYTETRKAISIQYTERKRLIRDLPGLGQITREELTEYLNQSFRANLLPSNICERHPKFL